MIPAPLPENESARLDALYSFMVLDTPPEQDYDDITQLASVICNTPIALISLVDKERQWFKSRTGLDVPETHRELAFCAYTILNPVEVMVVPDTLHDERFHDSPLVTGYPHIRFYAGAPLVTSQGDSLGSLCVIDDAPRELSPQQLEALQILSRSVVAKFELRRANQYLLQNNHQMEQLIAKLSETNSELDHFAAAAAHDMQEPLRTISGVVQAIMADHAKDLPEEVRGYMGHIEKSMVRLQHMTKDLLETARGNSDGGQKIMADGNVIAANALQNLQSLIQSSQAVVRVTDFPRMMCNPPQIIRAMQNLISNGIKYAAPGRAPVIDVTCRDTGSHWEIAVKDNGIGIDAKYLTQIFQPFFRLHKHQDIEGTGIGLAICKKIAAAHNGELRAESVLSAGSTFYMTIGK